MQKQLQQRLQKSPAEAETASTKTASAEAATASAHFAMAPTVVPGTRGSHKDYLAVFSQTMNLMPNIFFSKQYVIWMISFSCDSCD